MYNNNTMIEQTNGDGPGAAPGTEAGAGAGAATGEESQPKQPQSNFSIAFLTGDDDARTQGQATPPVWTAEKPEGVYPNGDGNREQQQNGEHPHPVQDESRGMTALDLQRLFARAVRAGGGAAGGGGGYAVDNRQNGRNEEDERFPFAFQQQTYTPNYSPPQFQQQQQQQQQQLPPAPSSQNRPPLLQQFQELHQQQQQQQQQHPQPQHSQAGTPPGQGEEGVKAEHDQQLYRQQQMHFHQQQMQQRGDEGQRQEYHQPGQQMPYDQQRGSPHEKQQQHQQQQQQHHPQPTQPPPQFHPAPQYMQQAHHQQATMSYLPPGSGQYFNADPSMQLPMLNNQPPHQNTIHFEAAQIPVQSNPGPQPPLVKNSSTKVYPCPAEGCTKTFTRRYNLQSHLRCHSGTRPFACTAVPNCPATFSRKHDLRRHMRSLHSEERPHHCAHCDLSFARSDALKRHLASEAKRGEGHPPVSGHGGSNGGGSGDGSPVPMGRKMDGMPGGMGMPMNMGMGVMQPVPVHPNMMDGSGGGEMPPPS